MSNWKSGTIGLMACLLMSGAMASSALAAQDNGRGDPEAADGKNNDHPHGEETKDDKAGDPVDMRDGSFGFSKQVLHFPGRGMDFNMALSYRSSAHGIPTRTAARWTHSYEQKIVVTIERFPVNTAEWEGPVTGNSTWDGPIGGTGPIGEGTPVSTGGEQPMPKGGGSPVPAEPSGKGSGAPSAPVENPYGIYAFHHHDLRIDRFGGPPLFNSVFVPEHQAPTMLAGNFYNPLGLRIPSALYMRQADGTVLIFGALKPHDLTLEKQLTYRLTKIRDRKGNSINIEYEEVDDPVLSSPVNRILRAKYITDTLGRVTTLNYGPTTGWLDTIQDPFGRTVTLRHDDGRGNLTAIESPGNNGVSQRVEFAYTPYVPGEENTGHSATTVIGPNEIADGTNVAYLVNTWSDNQYRVERQVFGGVNASGIPAGGTFDFFYDFHSGNLVDHVWFQERHRVLRIDPSGNVKLNIYDDDRSLRLFYNFTGRRTHTANRADMPDTSTFLTIAPEVWPPVAGQNFIAPNTPGTNAHVSGSEVYVHRKDYDLQGRVVMDAGPDWVTHSVFDPSDNIFRRGNLILSRRVSNQDPSDVLTTAYLYEPGYNQLRMVIDPRGTRSYVPPNGGVADEERYSHQFIFDYQEGDQISAKNSVGWLVDWSEQPALSMLASYGIHVSPMEFDLTDAGGNGNGTIYRRFGNSIRSEVKFNAWDDLVTGTFATKEPVTLSRYNDFGQLVESVGVDGTVQTTRYYPETDPSGINGAQPSVAGGGWVGEHTDASHIDGSGTPLPEQGTTKYEYDVIGRRTAVINPRGFPTRELMNAQDRVIVRLDAIGSLTRWAYDEDGNVIGQRVNHGTPSMNASTGVPTVGSSTLKPDIVTHYQHDILGNIVKTTEFVDDLRGSLVTRKRYDRNGNHVLTLNADFSTKFKSMSGTCHDELVRPWLVFAGGIPPEFLALETNADIPEMSSLPLAPSDLTMSENKYEGANRKLTINPSGKTAVFEYDGFGRKSAMVDPLSQRTAYEHDLVGNLVAERKYDFRDNLMTEALYKHDERNRIIQMDRLFQLPNGTNGAEGSLTPGDGYSSTRFQFDDFGYVSASVDDNGVINTAFRDRRRRVTLKVQPGGDYTYIEYDKNSNPIYSEERRIDHDGTTIAPMRQWMFFDKMDRVVADSNELGHTTRTAYDTLGRAVFHSDARSSDLGIPLASLDTYGEHAGLGSSGVLINGHGNSALVTWSDSGNVISKLRHMRAGGLGGNAILPGAQGQIVTGMEYDHMNRLTANVDNSGNTTAYRYDGKGNKYQTDFEDGTTNAWTFDVNGLIKTATDANGTVVTHFYDVLDRVVRKDITRAAGVEGVTRERFGYDALGHLTMAKSFESGIKVNEVRRTYDTLSNMVVDRLNGVSTTHFYDGMQNLVRNGYPGGKVWLRTYDDDYRLDTVIEGGPQTVVADYGWLSSSIRKRTHSNGTENTREYDALMRPIHLRNSGPAGDFESRINSWDRNKNRLSRYNPIQGTNFDYEYDSQSQLVKSTWTNGQSVNSVIDYDLDGVGNRETVTDNGTVGSYFMDLTAPVPADLQMNQYTETPDEDREYDLAGNLVQMRPSLASGKSVDIFYDYRNLMTRYVDLANGLVHRYEYDALGRRTHSYVDSGSAIKEVRYIYTNGVNLAETRDGSNKVTASFLWGSKLDEAILQDRDDDGDGIFERFFMHNDDQANLVAITRLNGTHAELYEYADYGSPVDVSTLAPISSPSPLGNPILYNGLYLDGETEYVYSRARYLDTVNGRWTTRDPLGAWADILNLGNAYTFIGNNPWSGRDPMGTSKWSDIESGSTLREDIIAGAEATTVTLIATTVVKGLGAAAGVGSAAAVGALAYGIHWAWTDFKDQTGYGSGMPGIAEKVSDFMDVQRNDLASPAVHEFTSIQADGEVFTRGKNADGESFLENKITDRKVTQHMNYTDGNGNTTKKYLVNYKGDETRITLHSNSENGTSSNSMHVTMEDGTTLQTSPTDDGGTCITIMHQDGKGRYGFIFKDANGNFTGTSMTKKDLKDLKKLQRRNLQNDQLKREKDRSADSQLKRGDDSALSDAKEPLSSKTAKTSDDKERLKGNTDHTGTANGKNGTDKVSDK